MAKLLSVYLRTNLANTLNGSTLLWQHINFQGEYDFLKVLEEAFRFFDIIEILALKIEDVAD